MSIDRFITWKKPPTRLQVHAAIVAFFGPELPPATNSRHWVIRLPGKNLRCVDPPSGINEYRWIEVYHDSKLTTSVLTRQQDEFTSSVADGLARSLARQFKGKVEWPT